MCNVFRGKCLVEYATKGVNVIAPPERKLSAWIGGSILGSLDSTEWFTKEQYAESGAPRLVVHDTHMVGASFTGWFMGSVNEPTKINVESDWQASSEMWTELRLVHG